MIRTLLTTLRSTLSPAPEPVDPAAARRAEIDAEWDRQLAGAINDRDRAELDAIFARAQ
jgi:hypothetical protein